MEYSIVPYEGNSRGTGVMPPWPALAPAAKVLHIGNGTSGEETIFFYDVLPERKACAAVFVLIHGLGDEADSWRHLIPLLSERGYRVLALDLPGFGRSAAKGKISIKNHAAAVLKLLEGTGAGTDAVPIFLAGSSMGAAIAEMAALKKPERFRGLILMDGSIPGGPPNPGLFVLARLLFSRKWYRAYSEVPDRAWASLYPYYADLEAMPPEDKEFLRQRVMARVTSPTQEQAFFATQRSLVRAYVTSFPRLARKIRTFQGKILLLWGEMDRIIPLSSAQTFKALRSDIELSIIPGAGHLPQQEKPGETARYIADWCHLQSP